MSTVPSEATRAAPRGPSLRASVTDLLAGQALNYVVSLLQITYLTSIFSPGPYGVLTFAYTLYTLGGVWTAYAVNNTGVMQFRAAGTRRERSQIVWDQFAAQLVLAAVGAVALTAVISGTLLREHWPIYALAGVSVLGTVMWPGWVLSATEEFRTVSIANALVRVVAFGALLLFVRRPEQLWTAALCMFLPTFLMLALGLPRVFRRGAVEVLPPREWRPLGVLRRDASLAGANWLFFLFATLPLFAGRFILGDVDFGLYAFADRFRGIAAALMGVIATVLFSRFCRHLNEGGAALARFGRVSLAVLVASAVAMATVLLIATDLLIQVIGDDGFEPAAAPLRLLALSLPLFAVNVFIAAFVVPTYGLAATQLRWLTMVLVTAAAAAALVRRWSAFDLALLVIGLELARILLGLWLMRSRGIGLLSLRKPVTEAGDIVRDP